MTTLPPDRLVSGCYLNELLLKLFARHDSHPGRVLRFMRTRWKCSRPPRNRCGRCACSRSGCWKRWATGWSLASEAGSGAPIEPDSSYHYRLEQGAVRAAGVAEGSLVFSGAALLSLGSEELADAHSCTEARRLLRAAIDRCLEGRELKSRQVMMALRDVARE